MGLVLWGVEAGGREVGLLLGTGWAAILVWPGVNCSPQKCACEAGQCQAGCQGVNAVGPGETACCQAGRAVSQGKAACCRAVSDVGKGGAACRPLGAGSSDGKSACCPACAAVGQGDAACCRAAKAVSQGVAACCRAGKAVSQAGKAVSQGARWFRGADSMILLDTTSASTPIELTISAMHNHRARPPCPRRGW